MTYKEWEESFGQLTEPTNEIFGIKLIHNSDHLNYLTDDQFIDYYEVVDKPKFFLATIKYNFPFEIIKDGI